MKVINVALYGGKSIFGGKETRLNADVISCDKHQRCSFYKQNCCLNIRGFLTSKCKHGNVQNFQGYTSRASKYYTFRKKWQEHESYSKLERPRKCIGVINDEIFINVSYVCFKEDHTISRESSLFKRTEHFFPKEVFNIDLIKEICDYKPYALMGGEIKAYQKECVPKFLSNLKEVLPEKYNEFIKTYPEYDKEINYVGRKALIKTVKKGLILEYKGRSKNEKWQWDGEKLTYISGCNLELWISITKGKLKLVELYPNDNATYIITDNEQVTEKTEFID